MADGRQVRLTVDLLDKRGYPTELVSDAHRGLGATDDSMGFSVAEWVEGLDQRTVAALIDRLFTGGEAIGQGADKAAVAVDGRALPPRIATATAAAAAASAPPHGGRCQDLSRTCAPYGAPERR